MRFLDSEMWMCEAHAVGKLHIQPRGAIKAYLGTTMFAMELHDRFFPCAHVGDHYEMYPAEPSM
jgi:hypothetical protein